MKKLTSVEKIVLKINARVEELKISCYVRDIEILEENEGFYFYKDGKEIKVEEIKSFPVLDYILERDDNHNAINEDICYTCCPACEHNDIIEKYFLLKKHGKL